MEKEYNVLKATRVLRRVSAEELAKLISRTTKSYYNKENGQQPFTLEEAKMIAEKLGGTVEDIFFRG